MLFITTMVLDRGLELDCLCAVWTACWCSGGHTDKLSSSRIYSRFWQEIRTVSRDNFDFSTSERALSLIGVSSTTSAPAITGIYNATVAL